MQEHRVKETKDQADNATYTETLEHLMNGDIKKAVGRLN